uniref:Taste receptor type 2 n=1 Tax=Pyxicephalus adspersus TaxID=30357 RepID=A0AAV2ZLQ8_PYXAD|nr:TPA: hypothetical protein GDO54_014822 [Pyxicephalus adspersus]
MSPLLLTLLVISLVGTLTAFLLNTFIILGTGRSFFSGAKTNRVNLIHLLIGFTNILMQCVMTTDNISFSFPEFYDSIYLIVTFPIMSFTRFSYWLMAWLCACYCTNITRFNHRIFIFIKKVISNFLPHLLLLSGIASLGLSFVHFYHVMSYSWKDSVEGAFNTSGMSQPDEFYTFTQILFISVDFNFSFIIIVTSLMVTVSSLLTHIWNMNKAGSDIKQKIQVHVNAARTMMLLLLLSLAFYISSIFNVTVRYSLENLTSVVCWVLLTMFPTAEGAILIQASPKLRNMLLTWLSDGRLVGCGK